MRFTDLLKQMAVTPPNMRQPNMRPDFAAMAQRTANRGLGGMPQQLAPMQQAQQGGGFRGLMNRPGMGEALQNLGFGMMAQSDTPGASLMGNIGRAAPSAMQAYQQGQQIGRAHV